MTEWEMDREIEGGVWRYLGSGLGHRVVPCPEIGSYA